MTHAMVGLADSNPPTERPGSSRSRRVGRVRRDPPIPSPGAIARAAMIAADRSPIKSLPLTPSARLPILPRHRSRGTFLRSGCAGMNPSSLDQIGPAVGSPDAVRHACRMCDRGDRRRVARRAPIGPRLAVVASPLGKGPEVGTPEWWKKHQFDDATFDAGKGYTVPGVDGYFDESGRRLDRPPANGSAPIPTPRLDGKDDEEEGLLPGLDPRVAYAKSKRPSASVRTIRRPTSYSWKAKATSSKRTTRRRQKSTRRRPTARSTCGSRKTRCSCWPRATIFDDRCIKARDAYNALADKYPSTQVPRQADRSRMGDRPISGKTTKNTAPTVTADAQRLGQDAAVVRHDGPRDQDLRQHPHERSDRSAGG